MATADASFDQNGLLFAHISSDCRLHLWDVASKKEKKSYVDKDHLTHTLTCYEWSRASSNQPGLFASGYSDGVVVIFDLNRGVVAKTIGKKLESEVSTGIVFSNDSKSVFVSSNDNHVVQYDVASGTEITKLKTGKKGVQRIAMNSKVDVIAVARCDILFDCLSAFLLDWLSYTMFALTLLVSQFQRCEDNRYRLRTEEEAGCFILWRSECAHLHTLRQISRCVFHTHERDPGVRYPRQCYHRGARVCAGSEGCGDRY